MFLRICKERVINHKEEVPEALEVTESWVTVCKKLRDFLLMEESIVLTYFFIDA